MYDRSIDNVEFAYNGQTINAILNINYLDDLSEKYYLLFEYRGQKVSVRFDNDNFTFYQVGHSICRLIDEHGNGADKFYDFD